MLGKIITPDGREAVLEDDGTWHCPADPLMERTLNTTFTLDRYDSPRYGRRGGGPIGAAARQFHARAEYPPHEPGPPGTIY